MIRSPFLQNTLDATYNVVLSYRLPLIESYDQYRLWKRIFFNNSYCTKIMNELVKNVKKEGKMLFLTAAIVSLFHFL